MVARIQTTINMIRPEASDSTNIISFHEYIVADLSRTLGKRKHGTGRPTSADYPLLLKAWSPFGMAAFPYLPQLDRDTRSTKHHTSVVLSIVCLCSEPSHRPPLRPPLGLTLRVSHLLPSNTLRIQHIALPKRLANDIHQAQHPSLYRRAIPPILPLSPTRTYALSKAPQRAVRNNAMRPSFGRPLIT